MTFAGNVVTIKLSENQENVMQNDGTYATMIVETHFQVRKKIITSQAPNQIKICIDLFSKITRIWKIKFRHGLFFSDELLDGRVEEDQEVSQTGGGGHIFQRRTIKDNTTVIGFSKKETFSVRERDHQKRKVQMLIGVGIFFVSDLWKRKIIMTVSRCRQEHGE